jgi:hypothetical protein
MRPGRGFLFRAACLGGAALAGAGAALVAVDRVAPAEPAGTRIALSACAVAPGPPAFTLPLDLVLDRTAPAEVSIGPFDLAGMVEPLTIGFHLVEDAGEKVAMRRGERVDLPVLADGAGRLEKIALRCRYGEPARVIYSYATQRVELDVIAGEDAPARGSARGSS